jgi:1-aminocyclopropane-1-carboxylate deaminase/D-cysteine desulfhydrase-like pyridoxal-dependent ACC family enzyme
MTSPRRIKVKDLHPLSFCTLPTPLTEAPRLSTKLEGPQILIKRDDLTGLAMGGNKARSLEYLMTEALDMEADIVVAVGPQQSNWLCNLTAAARKIGLDVVLLLLKGPDKFQGNMLLNKLLGAEIRFTGIEIHDLATAGEQMDGLADELRSHGRQPYVLPYGAVAPLGIAGYVGLASEVYTQTQEKGLEGQYLFLANGSGSTQAGLILGAKYYQAPFEIEGIMLDPRYSRGEHVRMISDQANETARFLDMDFTFKPQNIICNDAYADSYGPTKKSIEAVRLVAETEGIFIDPIYTGKVMAALADHIRGGRFSREDTVILYHSGGLPGLFAYNEELSD